MRNKTIKFLTVVALATCVLSARAQDSVATVPEGMITFNIPQDVTTYLSFPLTSNLTYTGVVSGVTSTTITVADSPAPWNAGALATASAPYFVKFLTGSEVGRIMLVTANTANSLTLDVTDHSLQTVYLTASGFSVAEGDTFEIFAGDTLTSIFGNNTAQNPLLLQGSANIFTADTVSIYCPALMHWQVYFFNPSNGCWQTHSSSVNANNTIIYPYGALAITRRSGGNTSLVMTGRVSEVSPLIKTIGNNIAIYGSTGYGADMTLSQLQLGSNWSKGTSAMTADTVSVWNQLLNRFDIYYQTLDSTWRKSTDSTTDQSSLVVSAGNAISILQRANVTGEASFFSTPMPYSLE